MTPLPESRSGETLKPYTIGKNPLPLDMLSEGPAGDTWYRVPSWTAEFVCEALKGVDLRVHRGLGASGVWTLSEATTGFKVFGDLDLDSYYRDDMYAMLAEFAAGRMLQLTAENISDAIARAKKILAVRLPNPFTTSAVSETETTPGNVELLKLGDRAKRIMKDKQSYDCHIDPRVAAEYERAYALVQDLADRWGTMSSNRQGEAK